MTSPRSVPELLAVIDSGRPVRYRFFWGHTAKPGAITDACFSQWWPCRFEVEGERFPSAEHFMMAGKARLFGDEETRARVLTSPTPRDAKALGREVRGFDPALWERARFELVTRGNAAKFGQDAALRAHLLGTQDDEVLVEASPTDTVWGIGLAAADPKAADPRAWRGLNLLGFALMAAREALRATPRG